MPYFPINIFKCSLDLPCMLEVSIRVWDLDIYLDFLFCISFNLFHCNLVHSGLQQETNGLSEGENNWRGFKKGLFPKVWTELRKGMVKYLRSSNSEKSWTCLHLEGKEVKVVALRYSSCYRTVVIETESIFCQNRERTENSGK